MPLLYYADEEHRQTVAQPLLDDILNNFNYRVSGNSKKKIFLQSGHDLTLQGLLNALDLSSWDCINKTRFNEDTKKPVCIEEVWYASNLIFELRKNSVT